MNWHRAGPIKIGHDFRNFMIKSIANLVAPSWKLHNPPNTRINYIVGQMTKITLSAQLESAFTKQKKSSSDPSLPAGCWH